MADMTAGERAKDLALEICLRCGLDLPFAEIDYLADQIRQDEAAARLRALDEAIRAIEAAYLEPGRLSDTFRAGKMACRYEVYALKEESDDSLVHSASVAKRHVESWPKWKQGAIRREVGIKERDRKKWR